MKFQDMFAGFILAIASAAAVAATQGIRADSMGLSKGSVFDVPAQQVYASKALPPGQNKLLPRAYLNAPPQVPHQVDDFLPITAQSNMCIACHNVPDLWGKQREAGQPTPIPPSHYTDQRNAPGKVGAQLVNARYTCNQCHVPQLDAKPLVANTFSTR